MFTVGIDLGTTASVVSYIKDGVPTAVKIDGRVTVPSVVNYSSENPIVGREAIYKSDSAHTEFSVKRRMGEEDSAVRVSADILRHLKLSTEINTDRKIDGAVITVPAHFSDIQRIATKRAASLAGIKVLRLINEPTSAALAFGIGNSEKNGIYAVYDFGGGTFDFSVLRLSDGIFQVLASGGNNYLGGDDIDNKIVEHNLPADISINEKILAKLSAKFLKENLGNSDSIAQDFICNGVSYNIKLTQEQLREYSVNLLDLTIAIASQVLKDAQISQSDLDGLVLVGGMTKLPLMKNFIREKFQTKIYDDIDPETAVSFGAALEADSIVSKNNGLMLIDVVPLTLGIETFGGGVDRVIFRNTPIPITEKREYTTQQDNQTGIKFRVVQGERPIASECRTLANFELRGIPPMPAGRARINVEFSVDVNGLLSVKAYEKTTGIHQEVVIDGSLGLTNELMMDMLEQAYNKREDDEVKARQVSIKIEIERMIKFWQSIIHEIPENFQQTVVNNIEKLQKLILEEKFSDAVEVKNEIEGIVGKFLDDIINNHLSGKKLSDIKGALK